MIDGEEENLQGMKPSLVSNGMGGFNRVIDNSRTAFPAELTYGAITEDGFTFTSHWSIR